MVIGLYWLYLKSGTIRVHLAASFWATLYSLLSANPYYSVSNDNTVWGGDCNSVDTNERVQRVGDKRDPSPCQQFDVNPSLHIVRLGDCVNSRSIGVFA